MKLSEDEKRRRREKRATKRQQAVDEEVHEKRRRDAQIIALLQSGGKEIAALAPHVAFGVGFAAVVDTPNELGTLATMPFLPLGALRLKVDTPIGGFDFGFNSGQLRADFIEFYRILFNKGVDEQGAVVKREPNESIGIVNQAVMASAITISTLLAEEFLRGLSRMAHDLAVEAVP